MYKLHGFSVVFRSLSSNPFSSLFNAKTTVNTWGPLQYLVGTLKTYSKKLNANQLTKEKWPKLPNLLLKMCEINQKCTHSVGSSKCDFNSQFKDTRNLGFWRRESTVLIKSWRKRSDFNASWTHGKVQNYMFIFSFFDMNLILKETELCKSLPYMDNLAPPWKLLVWRFWRN